MTELKYRNPRVDWVGFDCIIPVLTAPALINQVTQANLEFITVSAPLSLLPATTESWACQPLLRAELASHYWELSWAGKGWMELLTRYPGINWEAAHCHKWYGMEWNARSDFIHLLQYEGMKMRFCEDDKFFENLVPWPLHWQLWHFQGQKHFSHDKWKGYSAKHSGKNANLFGSVWTIYVQKPQ